jgi:serine/threonine protein kinase
MYQYSMMGGGYQGNAGFTNFEPVQDTRRSLPLRIHDHNKPINDQSDMPFLRQRQLSLVNDVSKDWSQELGPCHPRFKVLSELGEGTYGVVYQALDSKTNKVSQHSIVNFEYLLQVVALKKIKIQHPNEGLPSTALREMSLLLEVDHPGIIKLHEIIHGPDMLFLVFEFFNTDLKKYI